MRRIKDVGSDIHGSPSISDERVIVMAEVADVEEVAPSGESSEQGKPEKIFEPDMIVEDEGKH